MYGDAVRSTLTPPPSPPPREPAALPDAKQHGITIYDSATPAMSLYISGAAADTRVAPDSPGSGRRMRSDDPCEWEYLNFKRARARNCIACTGTPAIRVPACVLNRRLVRVADAQIKLSKYERAARYNAAIDSSAVARERYFRGESRVTVPCVKYLALNALKLGLGYGNRSMLI